MDVPRARWWPKRLTTVRADVVVAVLGESSAMSGEGREPQRHRTATVSKGAVASAGGNRQAARVGADERSAIDVDGRQSIAAPILETWFGGEAGNAGRCVIRRLQPAGKLTATFPRNVGQIDLL